MPEYHIPLLPDRTYHVSNRAIGQEKIFVEERNYLFFLLKCGLHVLPILEVYAYSLLPNHLHFIVEIKSLDQIEEYYSKIKKGKKMDPDVVSDFLMERYSNLFNSYTKAFNKTYTRKGALFLDYLKREEIENEKQFCETVAYVHQDPVRHGYCKKLEEWNWTSYNQDHFNHRSELIKKFGGKDQFFSAHKTPIGKHRNSILELD